MEISQKKQNLIMMGIPEDPEDSKGQNLLSEKVKLIIEGKMRVEHVEIG